MEENNLNENVDNENLQDTSNTPNNGEVSNENGASLSNIKTNGTGIVNKAANASQSLTNASNKVGNTVGKASDYFNKRVEKTGKGQDFANRLNNKRKKIDAGIEKQNRFNNKIQRNRNLFNLGRHPTLLGNVAKDMIKQKAGETVNKAIKKVFTKTMLKNPAVLAIIGCFVFLLTIVAALGGIDESDFSLDSGCTSIASGNTKAWWPIGGSETTTNNGISYATGNPVCINVTSSYQQNRGSYNHKGIDIACGILNQPIIASLSGKVTDVKTGCKPREASCGGGFGNRVYIDSGNGLVFIYAHLNNVYVKVGQQVNQGQLIGSMGNTGHVSGATGIHLHFEIHLNGSVVSPNNYINSSNARQTSLGATVNNSCTSSLLSGGSVKGNSDTQTICLTMKKWGLSDSAVAGIMGNMEKESSFNASSVNYIGCVGLVQWCYGRKTNVKSTLGNYWTSTEKQLDYIYYEITETSEKGVMKYLQSNSDASTMAYNFCKVYERPEAGECANGSRQKYAEKWYSYVKNGCSN